MRSETRNKGADDKKKYKAEEIGRVCPVCNHPQIYFEVHEENY